MHARTRATLEHLASAEWFREVGAPVDGPVVVAPSWEAAIESCASVEWENLVNAALNRVSERLAAVAPKKYKGWNRVVDQLDPRIESMVRRKISDHAEACMLPKVFEDVVQMDVLGVCMEAEYADVVPPGFFASQAYWYIAGRFPCGWSGTFPEGMLTIY